MTWIDVALIVLWVIFISIGARFGSSWTAGCLIGGFIGAFAADYYAVTVAGFLGGFTGSQVLASALLFIGGVAIGIVPAILLSKISATFLTHTFDSVLGLCTGLLSGFLAISIVLLWTMQTFTEFESFGAWKKSKVARPMHSALEKHFESHGFKSDAFEEILTAQTKRHMTPVAGAAKNKAKGMSENMVDRLKKE